MANNQQDHTPNQSSSVENGSLESGKNRLDPAVIEELLAKVQTINDQKLHAAVIKELLAKVQKINDQKLRAAVIVELKKEIDKKNAEQQDNTSIASSNKYLSSISSITLSTSASSPAIFTPPPPSPLTLSDNGPFEDFIDNLINILSSPQLKIMYLKRLHTEEKELRPHELPAQKSLTLLTTSQLDHTIDFIIRNRVAIEADLAKHGSILIARKDHRRVSDGDKHYKGMGDLPFTMQIDKNDDNSIAIYLLPMSKMANHAKVPGRKKQGSSTSVTPRILINPQSDSTKLLDSVTKKTNSIYEVRRLESEINYLGNSGKISQVYVSSRGAQDAIRTSVKTAISNLAPFISPTTRDLLFLKDKSYAANPTAENKDQVIIGLVGGILRSIKNFHGAGMIHNDVKDLNILVYIDKNGTLQAEVDDFDLSIHINRQINQKGRNNKIAYLREDFSHGRINKQQYKQQKYNALRDYECSRPSATCYFASPEVVGFTVQRQILGAGLPLNLYSQLVEKDNNGKDTLKHYYGSQLYAHDQKLIKKNHTKLFSDPQDDMFSLGIVLYMLITEGHYPTTVKELNDSEAFSYDYEFYIKYLDVDTAFNRYPLLNKFKPLILGLLAPTRNERLDSTAAEQMFQELINKPALSHRL